MRTIPDVINRLRGEFLDMPGLRLTSAQVQRLCTIDPVICQLVLDSLLHEGFLRVTHGLYARRATGQHTRPAKADIDTRRLRPAS
jgi:hypothetical protein